MIPEGDGPHPSPAESQRIGDELDRQYAQSRNRHTDPPLPDTDDMRGQPPTLRGESRS